MNNRYMVFDQVVELPLQEYSNPVHVWASSMLYDPDSNKGYYRTLFDIETDSSYFGEGAFIYYPDENKPRLEWSNNFTKSDLAVIEQYIENVVIKEFERAQEVQMKTYIAPMTIEWETV